jgi:hypothetical protein
MKAQGRSNMISIETNEDNTKMDKYKTQKSSSLKH